MVTKKQTFGTSLFIVALYLPSLSACKTFSNTDTTSSKVSMKVPSAFACGTALLLSSIQRKINSPQPATVLVNQIADIEKQEAEFINELKTLSSQKAIKDTYFNMNVADKNTLCRLRRYDSNATLSDLELLSTFIYTTGAYRPINHELKKNECNQYGLMTGLIVDGIMRLPMKAADPGFYRIEQMTDVSAESLRESIGETYSPPSFFSTTTERFAVTRFLRIESEKMKIVFWTIKKAQGPYLKEASNIQSESEVLFPPGSRFKVEKIEATDAHTEFGFPENEQVDVIKIELTPLDAAFRISGDE